jgi:hypothetical protein
MVSLAIKILIKEKNCKAHLTATSYPYIHMIVLTGKEFQGISEMIEQGTLLSGVHNCLQVMLFLQRSKVC